MNANEWPTTPPTEPGEYWGERPDGSISACVISRHKCTRMYCTYIDTDGAPLGTHLHNDHFTNWRWQKIEKPTPPPRPKPLSEDAMEERRAIVEWCNRQGERTHDLATWYLECGNRIERGEHRK